MFQTLLRTTERNLQKADCFQPDRVHNGGISGRGILLDYVHFCESQGQSVPYAHSNHALTVKDPDDMARAEAVKRKVGDILFVQSGFTR